MWDKRDTVGQMGQAGQNARGAGAIDHDEGRAISPQILIPFDKREAMTLRAAELSGKSEGTVPTWCLQQDIGRRVLAGRGACRGWRLPCC